MSGLFVRGGDGDDNLFLLDGNPVYHTDHVLGFFSAFNPDAVKNATFYKGSFPAEYGGRLSSVIDVRTNEGNRKEYHGNISIGLLAARANLEGPIIKDRSSFNVSVRRTWMELITWPLMTAVNKKADTEVKGGYHFYDMNAKVDYSFTDRSRAYLSFYMGSDSYRNGEDSKDIHGEDRDFRWRWGNLIGSAGWNYLINRKLFATFTGGYTRYRSHIIQKQNAFVSSPDKNGQVYFQEGHYRSAMEDVNLRASLAYRPNVDHRIRMGSDYLFHLFRPEQSNMSSWYKDSVVSQMNNTIFSHSLMHGHEVSLYAEDEMLLTDRLRVNAGLRFTLFHVQGETYQSFQPRFSTRYLLGRNLSAKVSYTKMNQYIHLLSNSYISQPTDIWVPVTGNIRPMHAHQVTSGLFWHYKELDFSVEGYYKRMNNLVEYKDNGPVLPSFTGWEDRVGVGKGRSYGLELMVTLFSIAQGAVSTIMDASGLTAMSDTALPDEMVTIIEDVGFLESIPLWAVTLLGSLFIWVLSLVMILTVYSRFFKLYMATAIAPIPLASFAGQPSSSIGVAFIKSYAAICLEGCMIVLACIIFSQFAAAPPAIADDTMAAATIVWNYIGELVFNMLVLVGAIKMSDRLVRELMGLG